MPKSRKNPGGIPGGEPVGNEKEPQEIPMVEAPEMEEYPTQIEMPDTKLPDVDWLSASQTMKFDEYHALRKQYGLE